MIQKSSLASSFRKLFGRDEDGDVAVVELDALGEEREARGVPSRPSDPGTSQQFDDPAVPPAIDPGPDFDAAGDTYEELAASARLRASAASVIAAHEAAEPPPPPSGSEAPGSDAIRAFLTAVNAGVSDREDEDQDDAGQAGPPDIAEDQAATEPDVTAEIETPESPAPETQEEPDEPVLELGAASGAISGAIDRAALKAMIREIVQEEIKGKAARSLTRTIRGMVKKELDAQMEKKE